MPWPFTTMRLPKLTSFLDLADTTAGTGIWKQALPPEDLRSLLSMAQAPMGVGISERLQSLLAPDQVVRVPLVVHPDKVETIGMDAEKSVRIIEGYTAAASSDSVGTDHLRAVYYPRRTTHTHDGFAVWLDEAGLMVQLNGWRPLLPEPEAQVITTAWYTWYAVPCLTPETIQAIETDAGETLLLGLDFYRAEDRLIFREHPVGLCPGGRMTLVCRKQNASPLAFCLGLDGGYDLQASAVQVSRHVPTVERLQRMLCDLVGAFVLPHEEIIQAYMQLDRGIRYTGVTQDFLVPYDHTPIPVGTTLPAGYVFGELIKLHTRGGAGEDWWRALDWSVGLPLDDVCPVPGITMPGHPIRAVGYDDNGTIRAKLYPLGSPENLARYQTWCRNQERRLPADKCLAPLLDARDPGSMAQVNDVLQVDGLALLFNQTWGRRAIIADIRASVPDRVLQALRQWCPTTAVLLIRRLPDLP